MPKVAVEVRIEVAMFSEAMEKKLKENDHKLPWGSCSFDFLFGRLQDEVKELETAILNREFAESPDDIQSECVDVANFAMMIFDKLRRD